MNINFSEVFKKLRRERELTQEQAAEVFCVSPQAVSRWENGQTSPDISLLPIIAEYFGVSIETLLGVENEKRKALHEQYMNDFETAIKGGRVNDCIEIARAGLKEFPHSYELMNNLMYALFVSGDDTGNIPDWQLNQEKYKQEIIDLGERILNGCTDDNIRIEVKARLGFHYCDSMHDLEKGKAIFESLPSESVCKENYMYWALHGEERLDYIGRHIRSSAGSLQWNIWRMIKNGDEWDIESEDEKCKPYFSAEERIKYMQVIEDIEALIFNEDDYGLFYRTLPIEYFSQIVPDLISLVRLDEALAYSEKACDYLEKFYALPEKYTYTSPLVRGSVGDKKWHTADSRSHAQIIYEDMLSRECYSALEGNERFEIVKDRIKNLY
ncbi:helix-turn-helix transcriptional regulator [uncultured Ruminococcus sp.]|uniref:helix-turn-helix transcriptional regulator n=1 Tax=uncultured Ruminococcus sp. TaxID=165186 RepID=UPI0025CDB894|nr:helix-turn-helix transcriptional regulator [uncultured Ruminococcus sp.]